MTTIQVPTAEDLNRIAIDRIITQAVARANDPDLDKWKEVYEPAKQAIKGFTSSAEEYERAIEQLTKEMKI